MPRLRALPLHKPCKVIQVSGLLQGGCRRQAVYDRLLLSLLLGLFVGCKALAWYSMVFLRNEDTVENTEIDDKEPAVED